MAKAARGAKRPQTGVLIDLPKRPLAHADANFEIFRGGRKLGELRLSKGGVDWFGVSKRYATTMSWTRFAKLMDSQE